MQRIRRVTTDHIDSCHVPDDDERNVPPSNIPTRTHSPSRELDQERQDDEARNSSGTERTLTGENPNTGEAGDVEKALRKRAPGGVPLQEKEAKRNVPPEERHWQDDIVTWVYRYMLTIYEAHTNVSRFDSKTDPENPKNASIFRIKFEA
jgi:hypothetical protein